MTKTSGKNTTTTPKKRKTTKPRRKKLSIEEMYPYNEFPYRLEYRDGNDNKVCYFQHKDHRTEHIKRHKLKKNQYFLDDKND
jgi:hypothetical protein